MKIKAWSILIISCLLFPSKITNAQTGQTATLATPQTEDFPQTTTFLDVYDVAGSFLFGLTSEEITLAEDGNLCSIQEIEELYPGVQVAVAFNMAPSFAIRDEVGDSRFHHLSQALIQWGKNLPLENSDDLSLVTNDGIEITHLNTPVIWASALETYQPQPRETSSNFSVLAHAIDIASDPPPQPGMKKVVLLLTPPPAPEEIVAVQSLTALAQERGVSLITWLVSSPAYLDSPGAQQLRESVEKTGGAFFIFSGEEVIPSPESYFSPLRGTYHLTYRSQITTSGTHTLEAIITTNTGEIMAFREFQFDVRPPNPIFVSPPLEIIRENPNPEEERYPIEKYTPTFLTLNIIIEFPDKHPRPLEETILYVDGSEEVRNTHPPFDQFTWDLSKYEYSQIHNLEIQAVDSLGLSQTSLKTSIQIIVDKPTPKMGQFGCIFGEHPFGITSLGAIILAAISLLICLRRGIIQPKAFHSALKSPRKAMVQEDRLQQSSSARKSISTWVNSLPWPVNEEAAQTVPQAQATLEPITKQAKKLFPDQIPIYDAEMTFGKDASTATILIKEASVNGLHARIEFISENIYKLSDEGSVAGTWVNYQPIVGESHLLQHGDIIHIGRAGFLFRILDTSTHPEVVITSEEDKP